MFERPCQSRRADVRRKLPDLRSEMAQLVRAEGVVTSVLIAFAFFLVTAGLMLLRGEVLPFRPGQHVAEDIVSRVDFTYMDKDALARARQEARNRVVHVYRLDEKAWDRLQAKLLELPDRVAARTLDETPASLRALFHLDSRTTPADLDAGALKAFDSVRSSEPARKEYDEAVRRYVDGLRPLLLLPEKDRRDEIRRQEELFRSPPRIEIVGQGVIDLSRTMAAAPTDHVLDELRTASSSLPRDLRPALVAFTANNLEPSLKLDEATTAERQNKAAAAVPASAGQVAYKANQILKHHEKPISETEWNVLKAEQEAFIDSLPPSMWFRSKAGSIAVVLVLTVVLSVYVQRFQPRIIVKHARAVALGALLVAGLLAAQLFTLQELPLYLFGVAPTLLVAMILSVAYERRFAMGIASLHAILVCFALDQDIGFFLVLFVGVLTCCFLLKDVKTRSTLIEIGAVTGLAMMATTAAAGFTSLDPIQPAAFIWRNCFYVLGAALADGFIVQGLLRPIEHLFRITTSMTLLERADASQPLLRRLAIEAPGTYNHSLQVAVLAEGAAETIGVNPLLCRVGAYYHDIGKVNKPDYFIENQFDGVNRHTSLAPSVSLLVIIGHVKDGVALAKEARLPSSLLSFIQQHHGTTLVEYFYHQARQRQDQSPAGAAAQPTVSEAQYRYPGPKPRSKEVAIVMLADAVESATRAMKEWTAHRIENLVHDLAMKRLLDGQFDECDLTIRELELVERSMVKTLLSIYHGRIAYPKPTTRIA